MTNDAIYLNCSLYCYSFPDVERAVRRLCVMEVLSPKYPGRMIICEGCGALLGHIQEADIYAENLVYCPLCKY